MSWPALKWAWETPVRGVGQHVLLALANRAEKDSHECHPSLGDIADQTGLGVSTIRRTLRALEDDGLIKVEVTNGGRRQHSTYRLMVGMTFPQAEKPARSGRVSDDETRSQRPGLSTETRSTRAGKTAETRPLRSENPPAAGDVVLRTKTEKREPGTTPAAAASADEQAELFEVDAAPVKAGRSLAVAERKELAQANAGTAVAAWCDAYGETHDAKPTSRQTGQVARESRQLLEAGNPPERVVFAARSAGRRGFATVGTEYNNLSKRRDVPQPDAPPRPSTTDARVNAGLALAAKYAQQEAG
jgi:DNA-binding Lrp family transcriptional regulator